MRGPEPIDSVHRRHPLVRAAWLTPAVLLLAFAAFEATKHRGWVIPLALLGLLLPFAGVAGAPRRVLHHPIPPVLVLAGFTFLTDTTDQAAPGFTFGLTWLAHIALVRALDRPLRSVPSGQSGT